MLIDTTLLFGLLLLAVVVLITVGRILRLRRQVLSRDTTHRCRCGYDLTGLDLPRCPECGRAVGFDATFEDLGVSPEELRAARERKAREAPPNPDQPAP